MTWSKRTRAWNQKFLIRQWIYRRKKFLDPAFRVIIESWQSPFSAACTTSIDLKRLSLESQPNIGRVRFFLRSTRGVSLISLTT